MNVATAYFTGSFFAENIDVAIPSDCTDPVAFMLGWIGKGRRGCIWFQFGTRIAGVESYADGSSKAISKINHESKRYYIGGTVIPRDELVGTFRDNIDCNWPDAIGGIKCRNGWGQPFMAEDEILEVPNDSSH